MPLLPLCTRISYPSKEFIFAFFYDSFDFHVRLHFLRLMHLPSLAAEMATMISCTSKEFMITFFYFRT